MEQIYQRLPWNGLMQGQPEAQMQITKRQQAQHKEQSTIEDVNTDGDRVVVRNSWRADRDTGLKIQIPRDRDLKITEGKLAERWAYLEAPHPVY